MVTSKSHLSQAKIELTEFDPNLPPGELDFSKVLFLDFDGVLHPECTNDMNFCFMWNFVDALREFDPDGLVPIVVSSAWRLDTTLEEMRSHFPDHVARQIVGVTPEVLPEQEIGWKMAGGSLSRSGLRQREVEQWMATHAMSGDWLAIDDRPSYFKDNCPNLFAVPGLYDEDGGGINNLVQIDLKERFKEFLTPQKAAPRP